MYLFVYGSLMEGFFNYEKALVGKIKERQKAWVKGSLYHLENKGYPALIEGVSPVEGELLLIEETPELLRILDQIENYSEEDLLESEYLREKILVSVEAGQELEAFIYRYNTRSSLNSKDVKIPLPDGSWRAYMQQ